MPEIYFAQIREDSLVERTVLEKTSPKKILCVGSGGCTAFSLLDNTIQNLVCTDNNPAQCALVELKKAGIAALDRKEFLEFLGEHECRHRMITYRMLRDELPAYAREYWDARPHAIEEGINYSGATERFYRFVSSQIQAGGYPRALWSKLMNLGNVEAQKRMYRTYFDNPGWRSTITGLLSKDMHLQFFPDYMFAHAKVDDFSKFFLEKFEHEVLNKPLSDNYFLSQFLFGEYLHNAQEGCPHYLSEPGYASTKRNLHKMEIHVAGVTETCRNQEGIDAFMLSNIFDWARPEDRSGICDAISTAAAPGASIVYRSMFAKADIAPMFKSVRHDEAFSGMLKNKERSMMYSFVTCLSL